jgi:hypothetical protein
MTRPHHDHVPPAGPDALSTLEVERIASIRAELAALGEDPADEDELAFASVPAAAPDDVRTVATLVELSRWAAPAAGLLPLERHRVWQRVTSRMPPASAGRQAHGVVPPTGGLVASFASTGGQAHEPAANGGGGSVWRGVLTSLALVAGVAMVLRVDVPPPPTAEDRAALAETGEAVRAVLEATAPGEQDGARARALADGYAERLAAARGAEQ